MPAVPRRALGGRFLTLLASLLAATLSGRAERLAIETYGTAEGLPHNRIRRAVPDSRGFVWFCTPEGLSRFDGGQFITYTQEDGLPSSGVNAFLETGAGEHWLATDGGICRLLPKEQDGTHFDCLATGGDPATSDAYALLEDEDGTLWAGTEQGLFHLETETEGGRRFRRVDLGIGSPPAPGLAVRDLLRGPGGSLWVATSQGIIRLPPSGGPVHYTLNESTGGDWVRALEFDATGRLWVGHEDGLVVLLPEPRPAHPTIALRPSEFHVAAGAPLPLPQRPGEAVALTSEGGLSHNVIRDVFRGSDGKMWVSQVGRGLLGWDGTVLTGYSMENGLNDNTLGSFAEDPLGRLWMGSDLGGAMRIDWTGFRSYDEEDGLGHTFVSSFYEDESGALWAVSGRFELNRFDGHRFRWNRPPRPEHTEDPYYFESGLRDHLGEWWAPTVDGLYRFPRVDSLEALGSLRPRAVYGPRDGISGSMGTPFEDSRGDLWMTPFDDLPSPLVRWERATGKFHAYGETEGVLAPVRGIAEAPDGGVWLGLEDGRIARANEERFEPFGQGSWLTGAIRELYWDTQGRLWIASGGGGMGRVDRPDAEHPEMQAYGRSDGLGSLNVRCIVEDTVGMIWIGTVRGIDRLDPDTGGIRHFDGNNGLPNEEIFAAHRDPEGALWFGTLDGISRIFPTQDPIVAPPAARISAVRVGGLPLPVLDLGQEAVTEVRVPPDRRNVRIDFFAPSSLSGDVLRYQFRLAPGSSWSEPSTERTVHYGALEPGQYSFEVRAVSSASGVGLPATVGIVVQPPFWRTVWFAALVGLGIAAGMLALHRYRLTRAVGFERLRTRIATDLHDDIGSSLTQIAILSEVASQEQPGTTAGATNEALARIASVSRETVDSMGDIVWAINPARDRANDLIHRMRRFASDLLAHGEVHFRLETGPGAGEIRLDADTKRQVYLIFKEALRNALRHSGCTSIDAAVETGGRRLRLRVQDDGRGFEPEHDSRGQGLDSMKARARSLDGDLEVKSSPEAGTTIILDVPLYRTFPTNPT